MSVKVIKEIVQYEISIVRVSLQTDATYIGRGSEFGNPYPIDEKNSRDKVCDQYEEYFQNKLRQDRKFFTALQRLHEKGTEQGYLKLACFCAPYRCHGETIKNFLEQNSDLLTQHV